MTFEALENSNEDGQPVILYEFRRGLIANFHNVAIDSFAFVEDGSIDYLYTSHDRSVTRTQKRRKVDGTLQDVSLTYVSTAISDQGFSQTGESETDAFIITLPSNSGIASLFRVSAPSDTIYLTVRRSHVGDTFTAIQWVGTVQNVTITEIGTARITCQQSMVSFNRDGLRLGWDRGCPHALYDHNCRVNKTDFALSGAVDALTASAVTVSEVTSKPNGWFSGGFLEFRLSSVVSNIAYRVIERRPIQVHVGDTLTLMGVTNGIAVGTIITAYPGCARNYTTCVGKFNNGLNYGGIQFMPGKSPYDGDAVF